MALFCLKFKRILGTETLNYLTFNLYPANVENMLSS